MMKRLSIIAAGLIAFMTVQAQNKPEDILRLVSSGKLVTLEYDITIEAEVPVLYRGTASVQEGAFVINGNGLEIYCDGETLTVVDPEAREIYIEKACSIQDYVSSNMGKIKECKFSKVVSSTKKHDLSCFKYDLKSKDSSWIITDVR